nr:hypothetical protein B0A51_00520 [Rachicladosporium sp. CCFEE 5018]
MSMPNNHPYPIPAGVHAVPLHSLEIRADNEIDEIILNPGPIVNDKNVWMFWHSSFASMHPYTQRNVRAWHRRFSRAGWVIRVVDRLLGSPSNVAKYLDVKDPGTFPQAFIDGVIGGDHSAQHTSDLVRWPLLLKYGGVYADVGLMQIGDLDKLWNDTVANTASPCEIMTYNAGDVNTRDLTNHFLCAKPNNQFFARCHQLFLALWAEDGGESSTEGMSRSPLLAGVPLIGADGDMSFEENGKRVPHDEACRLLTDYITQGQVMKMVMGCIDEQDHWNGTEYVAKHVYAMEYMRGSQLINEKTAWDGNLAFELMSLSLPDEGESETEKQAQARDIVESCLSQSFGFKLAHGLILRFLGPTLGSLWRANPGSDDVPYTYAHWLRYGIANWCPDDIPPRLDFAVAQPFKRGSLLRP